MPNGGLRGLGFRVPGLGFGALYMGYIGRMEKKMETTETTGVIGVM